MASAPLSKHPDAPTSITDAWWQRFCKWFNEKFPCGAGNHTFFNFAQFSVGSQYHVDTFWARKLAMGPNIDMVFVDTSVNDLQMITAQPAAETLLRELLSLASSPVVISVGTSIHLSSLAPPSSEVFAWALAARYNTTFLSFHSSNLAPYVNGFDDNTSVYYRAQVGGNKRCSDPKCNIFLDDVHLTKQGHNAVATMIASFFHRAATKVDPATSWKPPPSLPLPLQRNVQVLAAPLLSLSWAGTPPVATTGFLIRAQKWEHRADSGRKYGLIAEGNTRNELIFNITGASRYVLGYIGSYENFGNAAATVYGRDCLRLDTPKKTRTIDAGIYHRWHLNFSRYESVEMKFPLSLKNSSCMRINLLNDTSVARLRGANKFKLVNIACW
jgi:hypothetical protein